MGWDSGKSRDNDFISRARKLLSYKQARTGIDEILLFYLKPLLVRKMASSIQSKNLYIRNFILILPGVFESLIRRSNVKKNRKWRTNNTYISIAVCHVTISCWKRDLTCHALVFDFANKPINFSYTCTNVPYRKLLHRSSRELDGVLFDWLEKSEAKWVGPQCKVSDDIEGV